MKQNALVKTNLLICTIIIAGFLAVALLSYRINYVTSRENIEQISALASDGIYYQIDSTFSKPVNVSLTMANDQFLKEFLAAEPLREDDAAYIETLRTYLAAYQEKYGYASVFLVSDATGRYYNFDGLDRVLSPSSAADQWYYGSRTTQLDYCVSVDLDEVGSASNDITVFINAIVRNDRQAMLGMVGVGLRIEHFQELLRSYQDEYDVTAYLVGPDGTIEISADPSSLSAATLPDTGRFDADAAERILSWTDSSSAKAFWLSDHAGGQAGHYVVTRYLPALNWHLVVDRDNSGLLAALNQQLAIAALAAAAILLLTLLVITQVVRTSNRRVVDLTRSMERERRDLFQLATEDLFENVYEVDITHDRPANPAAVAYFAQIGAPPDLSYDQVLRMIAEKQVKAEFRPAYLDIFSTANVKRLFDQGQDSLTYEFQISKNGTSYTWMRATARLVRQESDGSLHMFVYRQSIEAEKERERKMRLLAATDEMTGLLSKTATQRAVDRQLANANGRLFALFLFDIDHFKDANDLNGHAFGDSVIISFAKTIRSQFRMDDLVGRVGGDEFLALIPVSSREWAAQKAAELVQSLDWVHCQNGSEWHVTASIGVAVCPMDGFDRKTLARSADVALYETKRRGRNGFTMYQG